MKLRAAPLAFAMVSFCLGCDPDDVPMTDAGSPGRVFAISHVAVVPMTSEPSPEEPPVVLLDRTVVVEDGVITAIAPSSEPGAIPLGAEIVDGTGRYLIPGLIDMHVHFVDRNELDMFVAYGVTTVRNMGDFRADTAPGSWRNEVYYTSTVEVRERVRSGEWRGPDMILAGHLLDGPEATIEGGTTPIASVEDAAAMVRAEAEQGYDLIKVYDSIPREYLPVIVEAAALEGLPVVGHAPLAFSFSEILASGMYSNEHLTMFRRYEEIAPIMGEVGNMVRESGIWSCPTLIGLSHGQRPGTDAFEVFFDEPEWRYLSPDTKEFVRAFLSDPNFEVFTGEYVDAYFLPLTSILAASGAPIIAGSDAPVAALPGIGLHQELDYLSRAGLSPYAALRAATHDAALALGRADTIGTIEVGRRADFVLLERDPLADLSATRAIDGVMLRGEWIDETGIASTLIALESP
jgi:imidazolonepropionase-like amidohydrolase